jgi:cytochrome c-type biogenesis protein
MQNGLVIANSISFILVFFEGIISFFSPCVIPLIPVYMSYLAGNGKTELEDGTIIYNRKKVFINTMFFVFGISVSFFLLGLSFTALGSFFGEHKLLFTRIGGILIILLGLVQIGFLELKFLQRNVKINMNFQNKKMGPFVAIILGFTFSFAWTPCIGPALSSVLIMASGASTAFTGNMLVVVYALGFLIPFAVLGLFTSQVLNFLKRNQKFMKYTIKVGGAILIIMGIMTYTGWMNSISGYLNKLTQNQPIQQEVIEKEAVIDNGTEVETDSLPAEDDIAVTEDEITTEDEEAQEKIAAYDFTLLDQFGNEHTLSDYKGKVVFLNFWATWCPPCKEEMPDIEELYQEYNLNQDEVVFLGVANPSNIAYPNNNDGTEAEITAFLEENGYTFPTVFDTTGELLQNYYISAFPTTFMIDKEGNIVGYVPGMMTKDIMINIINQTIAATE